MVIEMDNKSYRKLNIEVCGVTNSPCSYCQPVCNHRLICDECHNRNCFGNFDGWCRQTSLNCFFRRNIPDMQEAFNNRTNKASLIKG